MATTSQVITAAQNARLALAQNLRHVGVAASDTETITQLAAKVADADEWHPNPYWPSLDDTLDNQIAFVVIDRDEEGIAARFAFAVTTSVGNYTIDWGDGTVETLASGAIADHTYAIDGGTSDGHGKTTYKAKITAVGTITSFAVQNYINTFVYVNNPILYSKYFASGTTTLASAFHLCKILETVVFSTLPLCTSLGNAFSYSGIKSISLPALPTVQSISQCFMYCARLETVFFPALPNCTAAQYTFLYSLAMKRIRFESLPKLQTAVNMVFSLVSLTELLLPEDLGISAPSVDFGSFMQSTTARIAINIPNAKLTKISAIGSSRPRSGVYSLTFHPQSTFSGTAPQIDISYCDFTRASLVNLFNILPTLSGKQIKITGCTGAAELTAADRAIATGKGWTIVE